MKRFGFALILGVLAIGLESSSWSSGLNGAVKVDGSSTVFPLTEAVAEEFQKANPQVKVTVGVSGTGGGMKKFVAAELDIAQASRPVREDEAKKAKENKIEFMELPVAFDGLTVVVSLKNDFVKSLTLDQLKKLWEPGSKVKTWQDLNPAWPADTIKLYGPGSDSGTFEYFTEHVVGKAKSSRHDYTASEDDNVLVNGVAGDKNALGYFGYSYFAENTKKLRAILVDAGKGPVSPDDGTIASGQYPLARPLFLVIARNAAGRPEVDAFVRYYLKEVRNLAKSVGYTVLPQSVYDEVLGRYESRKVGSWRAASH
jgi:phosphate transport system substrate-binding protein